MKAKELMIGDWVAFSNDVVARVTHIETDSPEGELVGTTKNFLTVPSEHIEPVRLHYSMLDKNGWQWHIGAEEDSPYEHYWTLDDLTIILENGRYFIGTGLINIDVSYVHRLQQYLRLSCHPLADNFKIV